MLLITLTVTTFESESSTFDTSADQQHDGQAPVRHFYAKAGLIIDWVNRLGSIRIGLPGLEMRRSNVLLVQRPSPAASRHHLNTIFFFKTQYEAENSMKKCFARRLEAV